MINNLFSLRFWVAPLFAGGFVAWLLWLPFYLLFGAPESVITFLMFPLALVFGLYLANPKNGGYYHCPKCGKGLRKSKGADTCHHCGYDTVSMSYPAR